MFVFQDLNIVSNYALHWKHPFCGQCFPKRRILVWLTYWMDAQLYGTGDGAASAWRRTSLILHGFNAVLLGLISPIAGVLFFVHPLTLMGSSYVAGRSSLVGTTFQIMVIYLAIHGWFLLAILLGLASSLWVKEDTVVILPMALILMKLC